MDGRIPFLLASSLMTFSTAQELQVTGRFRQINGQSEIPRAMFGVHATPLTPERIHEWGIESDRHITQTPERGGPRGLPDNLPHAVECQWDRYQPALIVQHADWRERLERAAEAAAKRVDASPRPLVVEFWNEPYLNWGVRPGVNYDGRFYKPGEPGAPMTLSYADEPTQHLRWTGQLVAVRADNGHIDYLATRYMPGGTKEGGTWSWRNTAYRAEIKPWGKDVTQKTFWPGDQNVEWYLDMLKVYAPAFKRANPDATLIAGWDFHIYQNDYAAWEDVHRPTLDAAIPWIDGYTEHHYGGDTRLVAASYEVANAYAATRHGKFLKFYNTEAGGDLDPERPGPAQPGYNTTPPDVRDRAAFTYMVRDILHLLDKCPDKAAARAAHEAHHGKGLETAFKLLKPLRGQLLETVSPRGDVWIVAALENQRLTVAVFNDSRGSIDLPLTVSAPAGTRITGGTFHQADNDMNLGAIPVPLETPAEKWNGTARLGVRECAVWTFALEGTPRGETLRELQYASPSLLENVPEGGTLSLPISVPAAALEHSDRARVRLVQSGWTPGQHVLTINGHEVDLRPGGIGIVDAEIPHGVLKTENSLEVHRKPGASWCSIQAASLFLAQEN